MISLISAIGATVGDNILHSILKDYFVYKRHTVSSHYDAICDYVVFGAGGLIWENTYPPILLAIQQAVRDRKKCFGVGLGVQGFFTPEKYEFLKKFEFITVRNNESKTWLKKLLGIDSQVFADLMFLYNPPVVKKEEGTLGIIHPNIQRYPLHIKALKNLRGFEKHYIPFQFPAIFQYEEAIKTTGGVIYPMGRISASFPSDKDVIREVAKCEYVIAGHYHGVVAAFLTNTPCIILPLRDKVRHLVNDLGYPLYQAMTDDEIIIRINNLMKCKDTVVDWMKGITRVKRDSARHHLDLLEKYLG